MSNQHPAWHTLFDMEEGVADIARYGDLLMDLGAGDVELTRAGIYVVGKQLKHLGQSVDSNWQLALKQIRGQS